MSISTDSSRPINPQTSRLEAGLPIKDPLGQLLHLLQMKSVFYTNSLLREPWALDMPPIPNSMMFHLLVNGTLNIRTAHQEISMKPGDFVIIPRGEGHLLAGRIECRPTPLDQLPLKQVTDCYETLEFGGSGNKTEIICGAVQFDHPAAARLVKILPDIIYIESDKADVNSSLQNLLHLLRNESQTMALGGEAIITRLADIVIIKALREYLETQKAVGWLKALNDPRIGNAITLLHESPAEEWSLSSLAKHVGMSRTAFANQFKQLVGQTPIDYLTEWRMALAQKKLVDSKDTILSIAIDVGYKSESAFSRAFKKLTGKAPGELRKQRAN